MCGNPIDTNGLHTKSGSKKIFQLCDIPISVSAYDINER